MPLANYFPYPGIPLAPAMPAGMSGIAETAAASITMSGVVMTLVRAGCGYYIGGFFKHPIAGAALAGFLGLPGLFGLALLSHDPQTALPNRKRRRGRKSRRRSRR